MKPPSISTLLLASALFTPSLHAQDAPAKVREIEQRVLLKHYQNAVQTLVGSANESGVTPDLIAKRLQWLTMVDGQIDPGGKTPAANQQEMTASAETLNKLAWKLITSPDVNARQPEIALKLADISVELSGGDAGLKPNVLDTRARALFLLGRRDEAVAQQRKAVAAVLLEEAKSELNGPEVSNHTGAAVLAEQRAGLEATLALYRKNELPQISPPASASAPAPASEPLTGVTYITEKLRRIVIPRIDFEDFTVEEAIDFLRLRAAQLDTTEPDPAKKGVNFVIRRPRVVAAGAADAGKLPTAPRAEPVSPDAAGDPGALRVKELRLRNVPLAIALKYICDQTKLRYKVDDFAVTLVPQSEADKEIFTRSFEVPPDFASTLSSGLDATEDPAAASAQAVRRPIVELLKSAGINFGEGSSATLASSGALLVTNTPRELDKVEQLVSAATTKSGWIRK